MDKYLKSIKVVSLFEQTSSCYLTACEDKKSITLVRKQEWSESGVLPRGAEWKIKWVKGPTGVQTGKCRLHSIYKKALVVRPQGLTGQQDRYLRVLQDRWPPLDQETAAEWNLSIKQVSFEEGLGIEAQLFIDYENQSYFLTGPKSMMCNYDRFASPTLEPRNSPCKLRLRDWVVNQLIHIEQQLKQKNESKNMNSSNNNSSNLIPPQTTTTTTTGITNREVAAVKTTGSGGSNSQLSQLTEWKVGQVVLNYFTTSPGVGGSYSHYNSGHNVNGSGTQTNGDVNVRSEIGNTRDVSVNFFSNKSSSSSIKYGG